MQARRAARELALILFSQLNEKAQGCNEENFEDIVIKSVRILTNNATEELKTALSGLWDIKSYIDDYESEHETNLSRPMNVSDVPVPLPMTSDMKDKIEEVLDVSEKALLALNIAEISTLAAKKDVKDYTILIAKMYRDNKELIDNQIQKFAKGWDIQRLVKMDKDILRIAIAELLYIKDTPMKVVVDEALELAKKYSTEESSSFINGILAKVILENGVE